MTDQDGRPLTPAAETGLGAFMTGGLPGLLRSLDTGAASADDIDDPEALRLAEDAVARGSRVPAKSPGPVSRPIDGPWTSVAMQVDPNDSAGLDDVAQALESDGIDFGWDPYDPRDAVNFGPPNAGLTARKLFSIQVPVSQVPRARECLYGDPPQGVTYVFPTTANTPAPSSTDADYGFASSDAPSRRMTKDGIPLSDNQRLQRMAGGGTSILVKIIFAIVAVSVVVWIIGALITLFGLR